MIYNEVQIFGYNKNGFDTAKEDRPKFRLHKPPYLRLPLGQVNSCSHVILGFLPQNLSGANQSNLTPHPPTHPPLPPKEGGPRISWYAPDAVG